MSLFITFLCLVIPFAVLIGVHNLIARFVMPSVTCSPVSRSLYYGSALVGTPIHELSHVIVAVMFGHKIEKISLINFSHDGRLGYVIHRWNKGSLYQNIGLFFIAMAPLLSAIIILNMGSTLLDISTYTYPYQNNVANWPSVFYRNMAHFVEKVMVYLQDIGWIVLGSIICFHCIPSRSDFNNALKGSLIVFAMLAAFLTICHWMGWQSANDKLVSIWLMGIGALNLIFLSSILWWLVLGSASLLFRR